jgi:Lrp/AsnC family transcriptional regulator, regulator for asnA, asnC and gidA
MSENLNSVDEKIIKILKNDSRKSFVEIANVIGMSESAVRRRVKNLQDIGVIKKFTIDMGPSNKTSAITLISVSSTADTSNVSDRLLNLKGIEVVYEITGQYDIATIIVAPTILEINSYIDEIRKIDGVSDTNTVIILRTLGNSH